MIEEWKTAIVKWNLIGAIAIDLSKAFDNLPHGLLIAKLTAYAFDVPSCTLIASHLYNRKGCSTGFNLGPISVWCIYKLHIFLDSSGLLFNYADDNCFSYADYSVELIEKLYVWHRYPAELV